MSHVDHPHFLDLSELLARYAPAFGQTWSEPIEAMLEDPHELETITHLADALAHGGLREPVVLDDDEHRVANGMHRICAHVLTCTDAVLVRHGYGPGTDPRYEVTIVVDCDEQSADIDAVTDTLFSAARSLPAPPHGWVETDVIGSHRRDGRKHVTAAYYVPSTLTAAQLADLLTARLARAGVPMSDIQVRDWVDED